MDNEPLSGFLGRPASQPCDLEDLGPLGGRVVGALVSWLPATLGAENFQLTLEHRGIVTRRVALSHHPHNRGGVIQHTSPCKDRSTHEHGRDAGRQRPLRPLGLRHADSLTTVVRSPRPDNFNHCSSMHLRILGLFV
ncbi:MAG: hypothetical protein AAFO89_14115, partial [Planctomycetota bacterium]